MNNNVIDGLSNPTRLAVLRRLALLDTPPEEAFDRITRLAARFLQVPIALLTIFDTDRQFFKSAVGLPESWAARRETPLSHSFCQYLVTSAESLAVVDVRQHPLLKHNPGIADLNAAAFMGAPLIMPSGVVVGCLCVIDHQVRQWTDDDLTALKDLAVAVMTELQLRDERLHSQRVEASLQERDEWFRLVVDNVDMVFWIHDPQTEKMLYVSPAYEKLTGYPVANIYKNSRAFLDAVHPEDREHVRALVPEERLRNVDVEYRVIRPDGTIRWVRARSFPAKNEHSQTARIVGVVIDITERKLQEEALRTSERQYRTLVENLPGMAIVLFDHDLRYLLAEGEALTTYGMSKEQVEGKTMAEVVTSEQMAALGPRYRAVLNGAAEQFEFGIGKFFYRIQTVPIRDSSGTVTHGMFVIQDITARRQIEDKLRENEQFVQSVLAAIPDVVYLYDLLEDRSSFLNQKIVDILGHPLEELERPKAGFELMHPDDMAAIIAARVGHLMQDKTVFESEYRAKAANGEWRWLRTRDMVFSYTPDGLPLRLLGVARDVTADKLAAEHLRRYTAEVDDLYNHAPCGYHSVDKDGLFIRINDTELEWLGYTREEVIGKLKFTDITTPQGQKLFDETFPVFVREGYANGVEAEFVRRDGSIINVLLNSTAVYDVDGNFVMSRTSVFDITDRKYMEQALIDSENRFRAMSDASPLGVFLTDFTGECIYTNEAYQQISGLTFEEALGNGWTTTIFLEDRDRVFNEWFRAVQNEQVFESEHRYTRKDGSLIWVHATASIARDRGTRLGYIGITENITARKQVEADLAAERNLLRTVIDNIPDYIFVKDTAGRFQLSNLAHAQAGGVANADDLIGKFAHDVFPSALAAQFDADDQSVIQTGQPLMNVERQTIGADGKDRWVLTTKVPLKDAQDKIIGLVGISHDITIRKQAAAALAAERNLLRTMIDNIPDYIFVKDTEGRFQLSNLAHAQAGGVVNPDDLIGKTAREAFPSSLAAQFDADDQSVIQTGQPLVNVERQTVGMGGKARWVLTTKVPLTDDQGKITGLVGISHDITARRQAEEIRMLMAAIVESLHEAVISTDMDGIIINWNPGAEQMYGYTAGEMIGKPISITVPPDRLNELTAIKTTIQRGEKVPVFETVRLGKGGREIDVEMSISPIYDATHQIIGRCGVTRDIRGRKQAEAQKLELTVEREKAEMLERFISDVSHDLRTPLTVIGSSLYLLERQTDPAKRQKHLNNLTNETARIEALLDEMLDMSRLDRAMLEFDPSPVDAVLVVQQVIDGQRTLADSKHHQLTVTAHAQLPRIRANSEELSRALHHLVANALNYTPDSGTIQVVVRKDNHSLLIEVSDNGIGIPLDEQAHVFERFYRVDKARQVNSGGTGLGLPIALRIVQAHGGTLTLVSEPDKGSTFTVRLPAYEPGT